MAGSVDDSSASTQLPVPEATKSTNKFSKLPRRQLTLIAITICLNVLLWSSIFVLVTTIYLLATDPSDTTNIPTHVLTLLSSLGSVGYIVLHTVFSLKQRIWKHQRRHPSIIRMTSYFAVRVAVSLCILWLLTSGWNMITVARQPVCLPAQQGLEGWEAGATCIVGRISFAISLIALMASGVLFGMLAVIRRPFEAHVFKHGYSDSTDHDPSPAMRFQASPSRSTSFGSERYRHGRVSASTHRSSPSNLSNTDVDTLDLNSNTPPPSMIHAPAPIRSIGLGIFTSQAHPPPLPAAYIPSRRESPLDHNEPPIFQPSASNHHLPHPPRMSTLVAPSGFVPLSVPMQYPASAWRAVHPSPLGPASSSQQNLPHMAPGRNFSYRSGYSRSSISLTRPHRLSTATPPGGSGTWSSRSGSTGRADEGRNSPASGGASRSTSGSTRQASSNDIAFAILNGTTIPGLGAPKAPYVAEHARSASAPDATCGAEEPSVRKAKGWKPQLPKQDNPQSRDVSNSSSESYYHAIIPRSSSADLIQRIASGADNLRSKFSPDSSPDDNSVNLRRELEKDLDSRMGFAKNLKEISFRKSRSESPLTQQGYSEAPVISRMPQDPRVQKKPNEPWEKVVVSADPHMRRMTFDEVKNKPLPKIALL